jgi:hypothetical protein
VSVTQQFNTTKTKALQISLRKSLVAGGVPQDYTGARLGRFGCLSRLAGLRRLRGRFLRQFVSRGRLVVDPDRPKPWLGDAQGVRVVPIATATNRGIGSPRPGPRLGAWRSPCRPRRRSDLTAVSGHGRCVAKRLPAAAVGCRSISRNPPFGCDGDWRRRHRSSAMARRPAGQDSAGAIRSRNGDSTAPFAPESQSFLDHLVAGFRPNRSWRDPRETPNDAAAALASPARIRFPDADDPIGSDALQGAARIRHIAVRILYAQPATAVSRQGFWVLTEMPTFLEVSGQEPCLWRGISAVSRRKPRIPRCVSAG